MSSSAVEHRFAVVMCADVVGYSRLMGIDEEGTLAHLNTVRRNLFDPTIAEHRGRIVRAMGDGFLVEFNSVVDAVRCAMKVQSEMPRHTEEMPADRRIWFRVAIAMGDVVTDGDLIYGQAVDIGSRMESLAEPGGINVSRAVRDQVRDRLPIAFEDLGEHEVKNVTRPVRAYRVVLDKQASTARKAAAPPEKPAVAVLPFQNLGGDDEAEFFLDSVVEDLITELARARWFSVVARNTSFTYKGKGADSKQVGRELGVRYVVEGSLRKAGSRVRIGCQLVEAASGQHLWAERFDGDLEDSFELQDRITESVIGSVGPVLRGAEIERARRKPEASQDVYDLTLRALSPGLCRDGPGQCRSVEAVVRGAGHRSRLSVCQRAGRVVPSAAPSDGLAGRARRRSGDGQAAGAGGDRRGQRCSAGARGWGSRAGGLDARPRFGARGRRSRHDDQPQFRRRPWLRRC